MSGKGSAPRPYSVSNEEYANRWDAIFAKDKRLEHEPENEPECSMNSRPASPELCAAIDATLGIKRFDAAIQAENEACARMVEPLDDSLADAIRERLQGIQSENCNCPGFCTGACERGNV